MGERWIDASRSIARRAAGEVLRRRDRRLRGSEARDALVAASVAIFPEANPDALEATLSGGTEDWIGQNAPVIVLAEELPCPMPSWCAWLEHLGVLELLGRPRAVDGHIEQEAALVVDKGGHIDDETYFFTFRAERHRVVEREQRLTSLPAFLALFPRFPSNTWGGPVIVRAASELGVLRVGPPRRPGTAWPQGRVSSEVSHFAPANAWGIDAEYRADTYDACFEELSPGEAKEPDYPAGGGTGWPRGWPTWVFVQFRRLIPAKSEELRPEAVALYDLRALSAACTRHAWHTTVTGSSPVNGLEYSVAFDLGTTTSCIADKATVARAGAHTVGGSFDLGRSDSPPPPSGFHTLIGDLDRAGALGCGEQLRLRGGYLATALLFPDRPALDRFAEPGRADPYVAWLPQRSTLRDKGRELARFKAPELLDYASPHASLGRSALAFRALGRYARLLGEAVAALHATPHGGAAPPLRRLSVTMTYPELTWTEDQDPLGPGVPYREKLAMIGRDALVPALRAAWAGVDGPQLVAETGAARANRRLFGTDDRDRAPVIVFADFGGLTLHVVVEMRGVASRGLVPDIRGSTMTYKLGGELFLDACALAPGRLRDQEAFLASLKTLRRRIDDGLSFDDPPELSRALGRVIGKRTIELTARQIEATLRRADHAGRYLGAPVAIHLIGQGWLLAGMDQPDAVRRQAVEAALSKRFTERLAGKVSVEMLDKRDLSRGALAVTEAGVQAEHGALPSLLGVDVKDGGGASRWFSVVASGEDGWIEPVAADDEWWRRFTAGADGVVKPALLHRGSWFGETDLFASELTGSSDLRYTAGVSPVVGWVEHCGPSRLVLDLLAALAATNFTDPPECSSPSR